MTRAESPGKSARIDGHEKSLNFAFNKLPVKKRETRTRRSKVRSLRTVDEFQYFFYGSFPGTSAMESLRGCRRPSSSSSNRRIKIEKHISPPWLSLARESVRGNKRELVFVKCVQRAGADVTFASFASTLETLSKTSLEMSLRELSMRSEIFHVEIFNKYS